MRRIRFQFFAVAEGNRRTVWRGTTGWMEWKRGNLYEWAGLSGVGPRERAISLLGARKAAVCRVAICKSCYTQRRKNRHRYNPLLNQRQSRSRTANTGRLRSLPSLLALRARKGLATSARTRKKERKKERKERRTLHLSLWYNNPTAGLHQTRTDGRSDTELASFIVDSFVGRGIKFGGILSRVGFRVPHTRRDPGPYLKQPHLQHQRPGNFLIVSLIMFIDIIFFLLKGDLQSLELAQRSEYQVRDVLQLVVAQTPIFRRKIKKKLK